MNLELPTCEKLESFPHMPEVKSWQVLVKVLRTLQSKVKHLDRTPRSPALTLAGSLRASFRGPFEQVISSIPLIKVATIGCSSECRTLADVRRTSATLGRVPEMLSGSWIGLQRGEVSKEKRKEVKRAERAQKGPSNADKSKKFVTLGRRPEMLRGSETRVQSGRAK